MDFTYADAKSIEDIGIEITNLANEYNTEITSLFKKLSSFPYEAKAWNGTAAQKYARAAAMDKRQYTDFSDALSSFGNRIIDTAESIESCIKATVAGEVYRG